MVNRRLLLLFFISGLACLSFIFTIIVQAQSGDSPPPDRPADVSEESSATDWSQIVLPAHEESAPVVKPAPDSAENLTAVPPMTTNPTTYTIQVGDTLFSIARRFGVSMAALEAANQIVNPNRFYVGQILRIPTENQAVPPPIITNSQPTQSVTYTVQRGDALSAIAQQYGVDMAVLAAVNSIANPSFIRVGQILNIPGPAAALPPTNPEPTPAPIETPPVDRTIYTVEHGDTLTIIARKFGVTVQALTAVNQINNPSLIYPGQSLKITAELNVAAPPPADPAAESIFNWPVDGRWIVQNYRVGHRAIDIVLPIGTAVQAMAAGKIEYAGWNDNGYGNMVVIEHGNGWRTLYAHNSQFKIKTGDAVQQGDIIALSGSSGNSSMSHLHLEMMLNNGAVNPCLQLPGGC